MSKIKKKTIELVTQDRMAKLLEDAQIDPSEQNVQWAIKNMYIFDGCKNWDDAIEKLKGAMMFKL